jgi:hypothetical protein
MPEDIHSVDTMKGTSVNAFQQYAAFNLGCVGSDLLHQFREIANCSSAESDYYSDEVGSLSGVKDPLSVAEHAIKGLLHSTPEESSLAETLQAALIKCNQLQTELLEFLLPDQNTAESCTTESFVDSGKTTGIQRKWIEVTDRIDAIGDHSAEMSETEWRTAQEETLKIIDSCLLGFPKALSEIEVQLPADLLPFTRLARRLSELREQWKKDRQNTNEKIRGMYFHVLKTIEPELRPLFNACIQLQPALRSAIPVRIDDEKIETSLFEVRTSIVKKLSEQDSLDNSFSGRQHSTRLVSDNTVQAAAQSATNMPEIVTPLCQIPESKQEADAQQGGGVDLQSECDSKESPYGVNIYGIWVKLASELEEGILKYLFDTENWADAAKLSEVLRAGKPSERSGINTKLTKIRNAIRTAFKRGADFDPIPPGVVNKPGLWKLSKSDLQNRAKELLDQKSMLPGKDTTGATRLQR